MTKPVCCLFIALGLAACKAPKAIDLGDTSPTTGTPGKPKRTVDVPGETRESPPSLVNQNSGMRIPDRMITRLPDSKDMKATAPANPGGGVIATPPTADKGKE